MEIKVSNKKIECVKELTNLINSKRTILVADVSSIPGSQYQNIVKKLRKVAIVRVPKKNLFFRALEKSNKKNAIGLKEKINGAVAILFSDLDSYELARLLLKNKSASKAKEGQITQKDLEVPAGLTDLVPGPAISELGAVGIQIMVKNGKLEIKEPKVIAKAGEAISFNAANILSKLNILPFTIGFIPYSAYDSIDDQIYLEIIIDEEKAISDLLESYKKALPFAMNIGYHTKEIIPLMIQKAAVQGKTINRIVSGEPEEVLVVLEEPKEEIKLEEKKVEANTDFASAFF